MKKPDQPDQFIRLPHGIIDLATVCGITIDGTVVTVVWAHGRSQTQIDSLRTDPEGFSKGRRSEDEKTARANFETLSRKLEDHRQAYGGCRG